MIHSAGGLWAYPPASPEPARQSPDAKQRLFRTRPAKGKGQSARAMAGRNPLRSDHGDAQWIFFEISSFRNRPSLHTIEIYDTVH